MIEWSSFRMPLYFDVVNSFTHSLDLAQTQFDGTLHIFAVGRELQLVALHEGINRLLFQEMHQIHDTFFSRSFPRIPQNPRYVERIPVFGNSFDTHTWNLHK